MRAVSSRTSLMRESSVGIGFTFIGMALSACSEPVQRRIGGCGNRNLMHVKPSVRYLARSLSEQSEIALAAPSPVLTFGHQDGHALSAATLQAAATTPNPYFMVPKKGTSDNAFRRIADVGPWAMTIRPDFLNLFQPATLPTRRCLARRAQGKRQ